jgi:hypothetical protein
VSKEHFSWRARLDGALSAFCRRNLRKAERNPPGKNVAKANAVRFAANGAVVAHGVSSQKKSCQEGKVSRIGASDCEDGEYKVWKMSTLPLAI